MPAKTIAHSTLSKRALAEAVAAKTGQNQTNVLHLLQSILDQMIEELGNGNRLEFREFGVFETVVRKPRMALNPKTLDPVPVQQKVVVKFKPGRLMKQRVLGLGEISEADASAARDGDGQA
ncbi:MAG: HU family DNA-binding protein [Planctomycetota bacterium]|nr:MAG: HU family DNA-binding protein [Planctomycetota bacterium]